MALGCHETVAQCICGRFWVVVQRSSAWALALTPWVQIPALPFTTCVIGSSVLCLLTREMGITAPALVEIK